MNPSYLHFDCGCNLILPPIYIIYQYCDDVPADFQPEYFRSCNQGALQFGQGPIKVKLGNLNTQHMGMNVVYSGLESLLYEDLCKIVAAPIGLIRSMDSDDETVYESKGVFQGSKVPPKGDLPPLIFPSLQ